MLIFITGGARSGKSAFAEQYAAKRGKQGVYIATAQLYDDEMRERARLHREQRQASGLPNGLPIIAGKPLYLRNSQRKRTQLTQLT